MKGQPNQTAQPTPGGRAEEVRTPLVRRGWPLRWAAEAPASENNKGYIPCENIGAIE